MAKLAENPSSMLQKGQVIELPVSSKKSVFAKGTHITHPSSNAIGWHGSIQNKQGQVHLLLTNNQLTGTIKTDTSAYKIETFGHGMLGVIQVNENKKSRPANDIVADPNYSKKELDSLKTAIKLSILRNSPDSNRTLKQTISPNINNPGPDIDVLILYTPRVADSVGNGIQSLVNNSIDNINQAFQNSEINANLYLAHTTEVNYNETGKSYDDIIDAMDDPSDGNMDNIGSLRNQYLADIVVLLDSRIETDNNGESTIGIGHYPGDNPYAVVNYSSIGPIYTTTIGAFAFSHEVGHLFGAHHNIANDQSGHPNDPYPYQHGFFGPNNGNNRIWHTIMAYSSSCGGCGPIQYYSNPDVIYSNYFGNNTGPTGEVGVANNAHVIFNTRYMLRDYRTLDPPSDFTLENRYSFGDPPHFTWTKNPDADNYTIYRCITTTPGNYPQSCFQQVLYGPYPPSQPASWKDYGITIANPGGGGCNKTAIYQITDENRTGESSYSYPDIAFCVESN